MNTRIVLRLRDGTLALNLKGEVATFPSHMAALRARAMIDERAEIVTQVSTPDEPVSIMAA